MNAWSKRAQRGFAISLNLKMVEFFKFTVFGKNISDKEGSFIMVFKMVAALATMTKQTSLKSYLLLSVCLCLSDCLFVIHDSLPFAHFYLTSESKSKST